MNYNLAIIGYGGMGKWHHNNIVKEIPELKVKGAFDIRPEMQQSWKRLLQCLSRPGNCFPSIRTVVGIRTIWQLRKFCQKERSVHRILLKAVYKDPGVLCMDGADTRKWQAACC